MNAQENAAKRTGDARTRSEILRARMTAAREARGMAVDEMAHMCRCSPGLILMLEECGSEITHPRIAARMLAEYGIFEEEALKLLVHKRHHKALPVIPKPRAERDLRKYRKLREAGVQRIAPGDALPQEVLAAVSEDANAEIWHGAAVRTCYGGRSVEIDGNEIYRRMHARGKTCQELSLEIGASQKYMYKVVSFREYLPKEQVEKIAGALNVDPVALVKKIR